MSRVLLVEDVDDLRATMRQALQLHGDFDVVGDVGDGATAVREAERHDPDIVVLDLGLPDLQGAELITRIREVAPEARIVVYTGAAIDAESTIGQSVDAIVNKTRSVRYLVGLLTDIGATEPYSAVITLGPNTADVRMARKFVAEQCQRWGCADALPSLRLVISELVTNALVHAGTTCEVRTRFANGVVRIEVRDHGLGTPDLRDPEAESEGGRGLMIVSSMSQAWGVEGEGDGNKVVWAEIAV